MRKLLFGLILLLTACTNIDCPLQNVVYLRCGLYESETGAALTLRDTLTVRAAVADGLVQEGLRPLRDTVLLNRAIGMKNFGLPLAHREGVDTLLLCLSNSDGQKATDTLFVDHDTQPHFENMDCPAAMFHNIRTVRHTSHALSLLPLTVDSISIPRSIVNYDETENLRIYFRTTSRQ